MISYKEFNLLEARIIGKISLPQDDTGISSFDLKKLEKELDKLFSVVNIDIGSFGKHFQDRINDSRNKKQITIPELKAVFIKLFKQHKDKLAHLKANDQKVLNDILTNLNIPFIIKYNTKEKELSIISKTIMRKKFFKTSNEKIKVK